MRIEDLDTPVAIVDLDRLEANIARLQTYLTKHGLANRPHIKTHKIPAIAHMQMTDRKFKPKSTPPQYTLTPHMSSTTLC